jgi:Family of unknown function (DUF6452)
MIKIQFKKYCITVVFIFGLLLSLNSCQNSSNCSSLSPGLIGSFHGRGSEGDTVINLTIKLLAINSVNFIDSFPVIYTDKIKLDLDPGHDTCKFFLRFRYRNIRDTLTLKDTMTVISTRQISFLGSDCGFTTYFTLQRVINSNDSIQILQRNTTIDADNSENIWIYF